MSPYVFNKSQAIIDPLSEFLDCRENVRKQLGMVKIAEQK